jgi:hypothetical protein
MLLLLERVIATGLGKVAVSTTKTKKKKKKKKKGKKRRIRRRRLGRLRKDGKILITNKCNRPEWS